MEGLEIETNADSLGPSIVFHVVNDVLGFVLFMYQQIPSILPDMSLEFATILGKCKELETEISDPDLKPSSRRNNRMQLRELKQVIRRHDKFMKTVSRLRLAVEAAIKACPDIPEVMLVLGGSVLRPLCAYSLCFLHGIVVSRGESDFANSKVADAVSRKAIRLLISQGAGSSSCPGSMKLFLLVEAPSSFNHPLDFHPKRDLKFNKKVTPFRLSFRCRKQVHGNVALIASQTSNSDCSNKDTSKAPYGLNGELSRESDGLNKDASEDLIWFQCRHVVKGLASQTLTSEE